MSLLYRLTALPPISTLDDTDIIPCVHIPDGTNGTKKITIANLRTVLVGAAVVLGAAALTDVGRLTKVASAGTLSEANILDNCSGIVTITKSGATARVVTLPDLSFTVAGLQIGNNFSTNQQFSSGSTPSAPGSDVLIGGGSIAIGTSLAVGAAPSSSTAALLPASSTSVSSLRLGHGAAPTAPVNGDVWTTTLGMFVQINGSTLALGTGTFSGSIAANQIAVGSGVNALAGSSSFTWDGTSFNNTGKSGLGITASATTAVNLWVSTTGISSLRIGHGVAPTSPVDGDIWTTTSGIFVQINGSTLALGTGTGTIAGSIAANQIAVGSGANTISGSANFTWDGTSFTVTGKSGLNIAASSTTALNLSIGTTGVSSLRLGHGVAPTSPVNGDMWTTTSGLYVQINGSTVALGAGGGGTIGGSIAANQVAVGSGVNAIAGSSSLTWDGTSFAVAGVSGINTTASSTTSLNLPAGTTGVSSLRIAHGVAPTSPVNGDMWTTTGGLFVRINGTTTQLAITGVYLPLSGGTLTGKLITVASAAVAGAGFNIPSGVAPTSPVDGDMWVDAISGNHLVVRIGTSTRYIASFVAAAAPGANQIMYSGGGVGGVITGDTNFLWTGTQMFVTGQIGVNTSASADTSINLAASTTTISSIRFAHGVAPTSPVNGDVWTTTGGFFVRINGVTQQMGSVSGSIASTQVAYGSGANAITGSSDLLYLPATTGLTVNLTPATVTSGASTYTAFTDTSTTSVSSAAGLIYKSINLTPTMSTATSGSGTAYCIYIAPIYNQATSGTGQGYGIFINMIGGTATGAVTLTGIRINSVNPTYGGNGSTGYGIDIGAVNSKNAPAYGINITGVASTGGSQSYGIQISNVSAASSGNAYGLYISTVTGGTGTTWGIYQNDTGISNYFGSRTAIGGISNSSSTILNLAVGTTAVSSLRIGHGAAPTSPVDGDVWTTTGGFFVRINGATQQMSTSTATIGGSLAVNQIAYATSTNTVAGSANFTWDGSNFTVTGSSATFSCIGAFGSGQATSATTNLIIKAGTTAASSMRLPHGAAPTSPVNGDIWTTTTAIFVRINGSTVQLGVGGGTIGGSIATNQVAVGSGSNTIAGSSSVQWDGTIYTIGGCLAVGITGSTSTYINVTAATTGNSSIRIAAGTAPMSPVDGDIWYDSGVNALAVYLASIKQSLVGVIFTQSSVAIDVTNTTTETTFLGSGIGTKVLQANFFKVGKTIRLTVKGTFATGLTETLNIKVKFGSTVICMTDVQTITFTGSLRSFAMYVDIVCYTTGGSGTVAAVGEFNITGTGGATSGQLAMRNTTTVTIDTTTSNTIDATATWGSASASDHILGQTCNIEVLS